MTSQAQIDIREMHAAYCAGSGITLAFDPLRELQWYEVWRRGIRAADIRDVIRWMQWRKKREMPVRSLLFRRFIGDADYLEEDIALMRANQRERSAAAPAQTDRASVLRSSGRPAVPEPPTGRTAAEVLQTTKLPEGPSLSDDFDELKRKLKAGEL